MNYWTRAHIYAEKYVATSGILEYQEAISTLIPAEFHAEAQTAWAAIDQYEGTHRRTA